MLNKILERKKLTMSIPEFLQYQRGELTLREIYFNRESKRIIEKVATKIINNNSVKVAFITFLASCFMILPYQIVFAQTSTVDISAIDKLGFTILNVTRSLGYWVCIVLACKEILSELMAGGRDIGKVFIKYIMAFGSLYALPWVLDLIKSIIV